MGLFYTLYKDINIYTTHKKKDDWTSSPQTTVDTGVSNCPSMVHMKKKTIDSMEVQVCLTQGHARWDIMGLMGGIQGCNQPHSGLDRAFLGWRVWAHEDLWEIIMMVM